MPDKLNIAFYVWHFRKGYTKVFSYPENYNIDRDDIEILFFLVLRSKNRRVEAYYSKTKIKDRTYYWYYFGAFHRDPAILVMESSIKNTMPLLLLFAINLRLTNYNYILPLHERHIPLALEELKHSANNVFLGLLANRVASALLEIITDSKEITLSRLLSVTENLDPTPTQIDLHEISYILLHHGLVKMRFDEKMFDRTIEAKKIILPLRYVDINYVKSLKHRLKESYNLVLQKIKTEIKRMATNIKYAEELSNLAKIFLVKEYGEVIKKVFSKVLLKSSILSKDENLIFQELQKFGVLDEINNYIYVKTIPILEIVDLETGNEKILKPFDLNIKSI